MNVCDFQGDLYSVTEEILGMLFLQGHIRFENKFLMEMMELDLITDVLPICLEGTYLRVLLLTQSTSDQM